MFDFKVETPVDIQNLEKELLYYPNVEFKTYLLDGLRNGFDIGIKNLPTNSIECKNLRSAVAH